MADPTPMPSPVDNNIRTLAASPLTGNQFMHVTAGPNLLDKPKVHWLTGVNLQTSDNIQDNYPIKAGEPIRSGMFIRAEVDTADNKTVKWARCTGDATKDINVYIPDRDWFEASVGAAGTLSALSINNNMSFRTPWFVAGKTYNVGDELMLSKTEPGCVEPYDPATATAGTYVLVGTVSGPGIQPIDISSDDSTVAVSGAWMIQVIPHPVQVVTKS